MYSMMWSETVLHRLPGLVTLPPGLHNECVTAIRQRHNGTHPLLWSKGPWWSRCWRCQPVGSRGTCNRSCFGMLLTKAAGLGLKIVSICIYIYISLISMDPDTSGTYIIAWFCHLNASVDSNKSQTRLQTWFLRVEGSHSSSASLARSPTVMVYVFTVKYSEAPCGHHVPLTNCSSQKAPSSP